MSRRPAGLYELVEEYRAGKMRQQFIQLWAAIALQSQVNLEE
jgi:hypothetical protein